MSSSSALSHLWPHSNDLQWNELEAGGLKVFRSGCGSTLTDVDGREYLDGLAGLFVVNIGHGREEVAEAIARQASTLAYSAASNAANTASVALAERLAAITPGDLDRIFFCSGGSEAVESALKIARQAQFLRGFPRRHKVIARRGSYHGQTFGAMSLTATASDRFFGPFMAGVSKIPSPNRYRNDFGLAGEEGDLMCARYLEQEILAQGPESVAAFIGEPISAANGTHVPSPAYWQEVRRICDRHGVLLILDEVITGFGRTGTNFAAERFGIVPDLMTMAKGLSSGYAPIGAVAVRAEVFEPFTADGGAISHLLTFGGNAVSAAAAMANLAIIEREELAARSAAAGERLREMAVGLFDHPTVGDIRGAGLMCAIELVRDRDQRLAWGADHPFIKELGRRTQEAGLVTRVWDVLHLAPPLVVADAELARMVEIVDVCLTEVEARFAGDTVIG
jgi:adenosylmethionine-8-amino-7-oxononanoate aminotransferase